MTDRSRYVRQLRSAVRLLTPDEITPRGARILYDIADEWDVPPRINSQTTVEGALTRSEAPTANCCQATRGFTWEQGPGRR